MLKIIPALVALSLTGCISDQRLADAQARHRNYVCSHQVAVTLAANLAIQNAGQIRDETLRAATIATARAELDIVAACPAG